MFYQLPKTEESRFQSEILSPSFVPDNLIYKVMAKKLGRNFIGIDIKPKYVESLGRESLMQRTGFFTWRFSSIS